MSVFISVIFLLVPFIGFLLSIIAYFNCNKKKCIYPLLIGLYLGIVAYYFIPPQNYDLYRHHQIVKQLMGMSLNNSILILNHIDLETLPKLICLLISRFNNINLLQFFITAIGYTIIFSCLYDYKIKAKVNNTIFVPVCLFTFFGFNALNFISGLWNYIAIIIFFLALYLEYICKAKKVYCYPLYALTIFMHNSMLFPLVILIIYKMSNNSLKIRTILISLVIFIFPELVLSFINNTFNITILKEIQRMYNSYFTNDNKMYIFYGGVVFFIELTKLIITNLSILFEEKKKKTTGINGYIILLSICTLVMMTKSIVMIRFIMLIQFIGIVPLINSLKKVTKETLPYYLIIIILTIVYIIYFFHLFRYQSFGNLFNDLFTKNIISIWRN